jgi:isopentenyl-diphosphate Delta-isomerase
MNKVPTINSRKNDHLRINLEEDVQSGITSGLERFRFIHQALPELNLDEIDLRIQVFNKQLQAPLLISSMTGGTPEATKINQTLAIAAQTTGIAMGVGSQRAGLASPELATSYKIRDFAPDTLLFANLGAVQLNYGFSIDQCRQAVEMIEADALILHLNPLQEALQPEGNSHFSGLLKKIETICTNLTVPVIVKEVGWGISSQCAHQLVAAGVSAIDVAGAGGTSWSQVEKFRTHDEDMIQVAESFQNWGIPTAESIQYVRQVAPQILLIASGGLQNGIDVAKSIALGADMCGIARLILKPATIDVEKTIQTILNIKQELKLTMFSTGNSKVDLLKRTQLLETNPPQVHYS